MLHSIQFPAGSNIPHVFCKRAKNPNFAEIARIINVRYVPTRFGTLKPIEVELGCGHSFTGIVYTRERAGEEVSLLTPENAKGCIQCPVCFQKR